MKTSVWFEATMLAFILIVSVAGAAVEKPAARFSAAKSGSATQATSTGLSGPERN
jgi:hypothetical protein